MATLPTARPDTDTGLDLLDAGKARRMLMALALSVGSIDVLVIGTQWFTRGTLFSGLALPHLLLMLLVLVCTALQRLHLAIALLLWGLSLSVLIGSMGIAGLNTPAMIGLPLVCTLSGWLLGKRQTLWLLALTLVSLATTGWLQSQGLVPDQSERTVATMFLLVSIGSIAGAAIGLLSMANFRAEFARAVALSDAQAQQIEALAASERRFTTLFRGNPLPSTITDRHGVIIDANDAWQELTGVTLADAIGKRGLDLGLLAAPERLGQIIARVSDTGGRLAGEPVRLHTRHGQREFLLHTEAVSIDGNTCYINALLDQSDRLAAETAQRELNEQLEARLAERSAQLAQAQEELQRSEKLAALGSIVAGISHELNTPLGNALTTASSLQAQARELLDDIDAGALRRATLRQQVEQLAAMSDLIERSSRRAAALVASFKQVAVDQTSERRREFDLAEVVADLLATLRPSLPPTLTLAVDIPPGLSCDSYPGPLEQILANLVQNAATHAFAAHAPGRIAIAAQQDGKHLVLSVADDGKGMDEATLARVFEPFFTTRLGQGGSGLGLAISQRLATAVLGGTLSARSSPHGGSEFSLRIPRVAPGRV